MNSYLWLKSLHIAAVMSWMAGLFYLPRLFVYHAQEQPGSAVSELFKVMERRLMRAIMTPAAVVSWAAGLAMMIQMEFYRQGWFHLKLALVILMTVVHLILERRRREFAADRNSRSHRYFRIINEMPTLLMLGIVPLVIFKAF